MSRKDFLQNVASASVAVSLSDYFGINFARTNDERVALESQTVKRYSLKQHKQYFEELMKNTLYADDVRQLLQGAKRGKAFFVVGFLTTQGTIWSREHGQLRSSGVDVKVPLSAALGLPLPGLDPGIGVSGSVERKQSSEASTAATEIFAMAYDVVKFNYSLDRNASKYVRKDVMGSDDEEGEEDDGKEEDEEHRGEVAAQESEKADESTRSSTPQVVLARVHDLQLEELDTETAGADDMLISFDDQ
ncbi:uncharacterized protein HMPREF1541_06110 [Cyphellophora europaea CBS 101466]|uniref:Uncharacterized protein n=1 Tax=Cyphellophora europaea (strain CBS 101466) TaxID=1220924 RepID=W2RW33_CYPE1|nr:uncharacterized protein HMPREF1541_06110 [Cyphellophora europaea CBS 101466]ETN39884.1 hypothetical protein HMPREF1541_06110 [Cyphellophora europaea CBS 101466]